MGRQNAVRLGQLAAEEEGHRVKYEEMKPREINAVLRDCPLAYLVWGALEWHGVHNPVGLDGLIAYEMTLELCKETGGVVLPPVYAGYQTLKPWRGFRHTFEFSREAIYRMLTEYLENLYQEGFKAIVIVMGHVGEKHMENIRDAVARFTEHHCYTRVLAIGTEDPASWVGVASIDHAGKLETSHMLHFRPELVDLSRIPEHETDWRRQGHPENAKEATAELGAELVRLFVDQAAPRVKAMVREAVDNWPAPLATGD